MTSTAPTRAFLILLIFISMLGPLTLNILVPSLPGMVSALHTTKEMVQLTLSLYMLGMAVSQLFLGPLADRFGRRPVLLVCLVLYCLSSIAAFYAANVEALIVARVFQSFGATAGLTLGRTMIRDLYARERAASMIGYVTMVMVIAPMFAPSIGAQIDHAYGWRAILLFCALFGAASLFISVLNLPETRPASLISATASEVVERSIDLAKNARFLGYWGETSFTSGIFFAFLGAAPYLMIDVIGHDKTIYGYWFMSLSGGYMIGNLVSGRMAMRVGIARLILWGNIAALIGTLIMLACALTLPMSSATLFLPTMLASFANGLVLPNAISGGIGLDPKAAGAGSGLMGFGQMGVGALFSYLGGKIVEQNPLSLALLMLTAAVLAIAFGWFGRAIHSTAVTQKAG
jgi:MFS transporter, DHA1 family, multidrug resistance protein